MSIDPSRALFGPGIHARVLRAPDDGGASAAAGEAPPPPPPPPPAAAPVAAPATPAAPSHVAAAPAAPAAPPAAPRPAKTLQELLNEKGPDEAQKRMTRAARKALKAFGIDVPKDADINAYAEQYKADRAEKKAERKSLRSQADEAASYRTAVETYAKTELASLTDEQRAFVVGVAPNDPRAQLAHISMLRASGAIGRQTQAAQAAQAAVASAAQTASAASTSPVTIVNHASPAAAPAAAATPPAPLPAPATSAPAQPGPVQLAPGAPTDHLAEWDRLRNSSDPLDNGVRASLYFINHHHEIRSAQARRPSA